MGHVIYLPNTKEGLIRAFLAREAKRSGQLAYYASGDFHERVEKVVNAFLLFLSERSIVFTRAVGPRAKPIEEDPSAELRYLPKAIIRNMMLRSVVTTDDILEQIFVILNDWKIGIKYPPKAGSPWHGRFA